MTLIKPWMRSKHNLKLLIKKIIVATSIGAPIAYITTKAIIYHYKITDTSHEFLISLVLANLFCLIIMLILDRKWKYKK